MTIPRFQASGLASLVSAAVMASGASAQTVVYVDDDAPPGGDGLGWDSAYRFLQDALADAAAGGAGTEIHAGQGVYTPDRDEANPGGTGDHRATFHVLNGVALLGGCAGVGQPSPDDRNVVSYETILSGDLLGNDGPDYQTWLDNSYHVVKSSSEIGETGVVDGFTVTAGNAFGFDLFDFGGGMVNEGGDPTVIDCTFKGNQGVSVACPDECWSVQAGGGMANVGGSPLLTGCTFSNNSGGGMANYAGSPLVIGCTFTNNSGGGMINRYADPWVANCTFIGNTGGYWWWEPTAGIVNLSSSPTVINCTFVGNVGNGGTIGGGIVNTTPEDPCGDCLEASDPSTPIVSNCILWGNSPPQVFDDWPSATTVHYSNVQGGWSGAGTHNMDFNPFFVAPDNGDYRLLSGSPCVDAGNNQAIAGFADTDLDGNPRFADDPASADTGCGVPVVVDMGAYEYQGDPADVIYADLTGDGIVGLDDFDTLMSCWHSPDESCCVADLDLDGTVGIVDFLRLLANWG